MISLLHKLAAYPAIHDLTQWLAGSTLSEGILRNEFAGLPVGTTLLDVGGGTGRLRPLVPTTWKYTCVDLDPQKLQGFRKKFPHDRAIEASATNLPFPNQSFDAALLCAVSHHLTDEEFAKTLGEIFRILKPEGRLLFLDALRTPGRLRSRFLWSVDRGGHPRTLGEMQNTVLRQFRIVRERQYQIHHCYVLWTLQKSFQTPVPTSTQ